MDLIFYDSEAVRLIADAENVHEYTPRKVVIVLPEPTPEYPNGAEEINFSTDTEMLKTDIVSAYEYLITQGIDCKLLEDEMGGYPGELLGLHTQKISSITTPDGREIHRQADLQAFPSFARTRRIKTTWKVMHYYDLACTEYAGFEFPDTVRTLIANNLYKLQMPDGTEIGEYEYFRQLVTSGVPIPIKGMWAQTIAARDAIGRFN